jgi:hypothetical protein
MMEVEGLVAASWWPLHISSFDIEDEGEMFF